MQYGVAELNVPHLFPEEDGKKNIDNELYDLLKSLPSFIHHLATFGHCALSILYIQYFFLWRSTLINLLISFLSVHMTIYALMYVLWVRKKRLAKVIMQQRNCSPRPMSRPLRVLLLISTPDHGAGQSRSIWCNFTEQHRHAMLQIRELKTSSSEE